MDVKQYLGDGVYANYDGEFIILTTENGIEVTNEIFLDRAVFGALAKYAHSRFMALADAQNRNG
jgi:hypothetical protein